MKLGSVTTLDNKNKTASKNLTLLPCQKIMTSLPFLQFTTDFEQSRNRIPDP